MAIGTYAELQTAVANWNDRTDSEYLSQVPVFVALAEEQINARMNLRTLESDVPLSGVLGSRFIPLPTGYRDAAALWRVMDYGRDERIFLPVEELRVTTNQGDPMYFSIDGVNIAFEYPLNAAYNYVLRRIGGVGLVNDTDTNLILTNYPSVYLQGSLFFAAKWLRDAELREEMAQGFDVALSDAIKRENRVKQNAKLRTDVVSVMSGPANIFRGY